MRLLRPVPFGIHGRPVADLACGRASVRRSRVRIKSDGGICDAAARERADPRRLADRRPANRQESGDAVQRRLSDNGAVLNIEGLAVSAVTDILAICPDLNDQITVNDKTPITDGHIDLYKSGKHSNANLIGRVFVQVKGRTTRGKVKKNVESASFPIDRETLHFFRNHGGGLYFYVPISAEGKRKGVFYVSMMPWRIDAWMADLKSGQKTMSVKMKRFPTRPLEVQRLVYIAWESRVQTGAAKVDLGQIMSQLESIELLAMTELSDKQPTAFNLMDTDFVATAKTLTGSRIPLNIELVAYPGHHLPRAMTVPIACGGVEYGSPMIESLEEGISRITLSEGLSIRAVRDGRGLRTDIDLTTAGGLFDQLKDMTFFLAAAEGQPLMIGGNRMPPTPSELPDIAELSARRRLAAGMVAMLDSLDLGGPYARSLEITEDQKRNLLVLHQALVLKEEVPIKTDGLGRMKMTVGDGYVSVLVMEGSDEDHRKVVDPFSSDLHGHFVLKNSTPDDSKDQDAQWVTIYEGVPPEELASLLNLHPESISDAYAALPSRTTARNQANQMVLNLLSAADESKDLRAQYLLRGARNLVDWLVAVAPEDLTHKINQWQTWSRLGGLGSDEIQEIRQARRKLPSSDAVEARLQEACLAILLHDQGELDFLVDALSDEDRGRLMSWPIWNLTKVAPGAE